MNPLPLYTHTFTLNKLPRAFATLAQSPEGFFKGVVFYE
jgi:hypothetical protein